MAEVVRYRLDDTTEVAFEVDRGAGFGPAGTKEVLGRVRDAVRPAVEAAEIVLDQLKDAGPDEVKVKFGVKVSGKMDWLVAKAATDANFEVTLVWRPAEADPDAGSG
jgi:ribosomal protein L9